VQNPSAGGLIRNKKTRDEIDAKWENSIAFNSPMWYGWEERGNTLPKRKPIRIKWQFCLRVGLENGFSGADELILGDLGTTFPWSRMLCVQAVPPLFQWGRKGRCEMARQLRLCLMASVFALTWLACPGARRAHADIILGTPMITVVGGITLLTYTPMLDSGELVQTTDGFGMTCPVPSSNFGMLMQPSDWQGSLVPLGPTSTEVVWTYKPVSVTSEIIGPASLGTFGFFSDVSGVTTGQYVAMTHLASNGQPTSNVGTTLVPTLGPVPEPSTLTLACVAGISCGGCYLWRRRVGRP
jgi:hypothetical protein